MDDQVDYSQVERFRELARMMECDEDEKHWDERLKRVVKPKAPRPS
jgi:hypothetical protein